MNKDMYNKHKSVLAFAPVTISSDATTAGIEIDTLGFESVTVNAFTGVVTAGDVTLSVYECATSGGSYTAVPSARLIGSFSTMDATNSINSVGVVPQYRYVKAYLTSDNSANLLAGATIELGCPTKATVR